MIIWGSNNALQVWKLLRPVNMINEKLFSFLIVITATRVPLRQHVSRSARKKGELF